MRTKEIKISGEKRDAVLVAGGPGFKIYTASGLDGWIVAAAKKVFVVEQSSPDFMTVGRYVNFKFQPISVQSSIQEGFNHFLKSKIQPQESPESIP